MRLSVIIPAFNEELRLPNTLKRIVFYLSHHMADSFEILIVDDGSSDGTATVVRALADQFHPHVRLYSLPKNRGRGFAVREGMKLTRGEYLLETDADGSVNEEAIMQFVKTLDADLGVDALIGSRNMRGAEILTPQPWLRVFLGNVFLVLAKIFFGYAITDYTLGFKMFRRAAAMDIFSYQKDDRFLAEAEIVYVAMKRKWNLRELPVLWTDFRNSRVNPFRDSVHSFMGLLELLRRNRRGFYDGPRKDAMV